MAGNKPLIFAPGKNAREHFKCDADCLPVSDLWLLIPPIFATGQNHPPSLLRAEGGKDAVFLPQAKMLASISNATRSVCLSPTCGFLIPPIFATGQNHPPSLLRAEEGKDADFCPRQKSPYPLCQPRYLFTLPLRTDEEEVSTFCNFELLANL